MTLIQSPRVAMGNIVPDEAGRILIIQRDGLAKTGGGDWAIPGGKLDPGETLEQGAARELLEETGISATKMVRLPIVTEDMAWGPEHHFVTLYFVAESWTGTPVIMEPTKHTGLDWIEPRTLMQLVADPNPGFPLFEPLVKLAKEGGFSRMHIS